MSVSVTFNGSLYIIPTNNDVGWGTNLTNYLVAIAAGSLQKTGGSFTLSAETDFGGTFGIKSLYYKSRTVNIADVGILRLANNGDSIAWRNSTNNGNHLLAVNNSDLLTFDGVPVAVGGSGTVLTGVANTLAYYPASTNTVDDLPGITASRALVSNSSGLPIASVTTTAELAFVSGVTSAIQTQLDAKSSSTLTSAHLFVGNGSNIATDTAVTGDVTITNTGVTSISSGVIVNNDINASAAISLTKLAPTTISRALASDASGFIVASTTTATELGFIAGVTSSIQTQIDTKAPSNNPTFTGTIGTPLTASSIVKTDGSGNLTTGTVSLTTQVSGTLPVANGGTSLTTKLFTTGTYVGNGGTQSVAHGLGATPDLVMISVTGTGTNIQAMFITGMASPNSHQFNGVNQVNMITSVDSTNINIGANTSVNQNTVSYAFVAFKAQ